MAENDEDTAADEAATDDATDATDAMTEPEPEPEPVELAFGVPVTESRGQRVLHPSREEYLATAEALRADGFVMLLDVCGVDYLTHAGRTLPTPVQPERFEVVVNLINHARGERIRMRVQVPEADPHIPSLFDIWPGCETLERETYDMFGVVFDDHPDPTRILMPEDWVGHPLRKDYAVGRIPVQFKGAPTNR